MDTIELSFSIVDGQPLSCLTKPCTIKNHEQFPLEIVKDKCASDLGSYVQNVLYRRTMNL